MQSASVERVPRKHPCADCRMCQGCSESRCHACRTKGNGNGGHKLSMREQIALFDSLNPGLASRSRTCHCLERTGENES